MKAYASARWPVRTVVTVALAAIAVGVVALMALSPRHRALYLGSLGAA